MMPPYAVLHTIYSIDDLASHSPQRSQVRMRMWQIRGAARVNSAIRQIKIRQYSCSRWLRPIRQTSVL